ncbi:MAG: LacI family DNA-binding transcriptional regulator [Burkholderiales bacterium]|nr:LacI family DNA-binding transcriptional regulator [Burkholderiales bacterium]
MLTDSGRVEVQEKENTQPVTLLDVAREAGVSPSTVSRILNGTAKVSPDKRKAVETAIATMKFEPNQLAQGLKSGRSMTIGIVVQDIASPFFDETLHGVDDGLKDTGYASVIVSGHWNAAEEAARIKLLLARKVDGIILLSGRIEDKTVLEFSKHRPIVATGRALHSATAIGFKLDNEYGAFLATRHLIELGHRRIAFVSGPVNNSDAMERLAGYRRALQESGIEYEEELVAEGNFHEASGLMAIHHLIETQRQFTAVFAANDLTAYGVRLGLYRKGIRVPEDISLIGFDDLPSSTYTTPPLTTIHQPLYDMGLLATRTLLALISGDEIVNQLPPLELIARETTRRLR